MIVLKAITETLELVTTSTAQLDYSITWADLTASAFGPSTTEGSIVTATTTVILAAPAAATQRQLKLLMIRNRSTTVANTVRLQKDISATEYWLSPTFTLGPSESLVYSIDEGWQKFSAAGAKQLADLPNIGYTGVSYPYFKVGTGPEASGIQYSFSKDSGLPGAWAPGTPGLNGRVTDGTTATDNGCIKVPNAATGSNFIVKHVATATGAACTIELIDALWVNSGLVVTTLTNQAITSPAWPARDLLDTVNGEGINVGILVTTATTNAAAITGTILSYTSSDGTAGRTATMASFPATAVIGTWVPFQLQAGDTGIRSVQGVTLTTSYVAGAISLVAFRRIDLCGVSGTNVAQGNLAMPLPGIKIAPGVCMLLNVIPGSTTSLNLNGEIVVQSR